MVSPVLEIVVVVLGVLPGVVGVLSGVASIVWDAIQIRNSMKSKAKMERDRAALVIQRAYRSYKWKCDSNGHFLKSGHI